jgi:hypothetical protein
MYCGEDAVEKHVCDVCQQEAENIDELSVTDKDKDTTDEYYKKWYEKNKKQLSEKRKKRYKQDKERREQIRLASARYYWLNKRRAKSIGLNSVKFEELKLEPDSMEEFMIENTNDIRYGLVVQVPVYYANQAADVLRRSSQTLRLWFKDGRLPDVFKRNSKQYRLYTEDQMRILAENRHWLSFTVKEFDLHPFFVLVSEELEKLQPDGIEPMLKEEWREDPTACPFCGGSPSLQTKIEGSWTYTSCFACMSPVEFYGRRVSAKYVVSGLCEVCGASLDGIHEGVDRNSLRVICDRCGTKAKKFSVAKV